MSLPGGYQLQEGPTCWITTLSMLTGIDVELFVSESSLAPYIMLGDPDHSGWTHFELKKGVNEPWVELLRDNGFKLDFWDIHPRTPVYGMMVIEPVEQSGHVVAVDHALVVNPSHPYAYMETPSQYLERTGQIVVSYITVTPL